MRIGLFDSGVGGFTVLKKVVELCPNSSFIYLADTARLPYGVKTSTEIIQIAEEILALDSSILLLLGIHILKEYSVILIKIILQIKCHIK